MDQARIWLKPQLQGVVPLRTGHLAISLGLGAELIEGVRSDRLLADENSLRQWKFRLARLHRDANPYRHLLADELLENVLTEIENCKSRKISLGVELNGGIGDHLEALSLIIPWAQMHDINLNLVMSKKRQAQIGLLIPQSKKILCVSKEKTKIRSIPSLAIRAALMEETNPSHYSAWIPSSKANQRDEHRYLCCWRAEGFGDKFSAHSRSVPWNIVQNFYHSLMHKDRKTCITDITDWKAWERERLKYMGINMINPRHKSILELIKQCRISHVVTIDTALAHLCAASGVQANILLSLFADERWEELYRPENNYGQLLKLWRSTQFGSWSTVLSSLSTSLTTGP